LDKDGPAVSSNTQDKALLRRLWSDYLAPQRSRLVIAAIYMAIYAAATSAYIFVIRIVIDAATQGGGIDDYARLILPIALGVPAISAATNYLQRIVTNKIALTAVADMQTHMYDAVLRADLATVSQEPSGALISRFVSDVGVVSGALIRIIGNLVRDVLTVIFIIGSMLYMSWKLSAAMAVFIIAIAPLIALSQKMRGSANDAQAHVGRITGELKESFDGARLVRAYALEERERTRLGESFAKRISLFLKLVSQQARVDPILEILGGVAIAAVIIFGVWLLQQGSITGGEIAGILGGLLLLAPKLRALGTMNNVVQEMLASLSRIFDIADMGSTIADPPDAKALENVKGHIRFENVHFTYPDGTQALRGVGLEAKPGQRIALVGPSGGGKSTILNLVPRLFDATSGLITIDGQDVQDTTLASLRQHIALVSQNVTLFSGTIADNIALGRQTATRDQIIEAAKAADAHAFIMALPEGYDTTLGEAGDTLSGGQRQRLSIARALLRDAPILLLDEATSALDASSEAKVQAALDRLSEGRTTLIVAHRLATIRGADRIYVIDGGRVVEQGSETELREKKGVFARLKALQSV
jgi:subfamily B ATP-binding cassette protein MsbA